MNRGCGEKGGMVSKEHEIQWRAFVGLLEAWRDSGLFLKMHPDAPELLRLTHLKEGMSGCGRCGARYPEVDIAGSITADGRTDVYEGRVTQRAMHACPRKPDDPPASEFCPELRVDIVDSEPILMFDIFPDVGFVAAQLAATSEP